ncbi:MAG: hypothetical protein IAG10_21225 [Planctomycetaceae bacterium]|nr:hypothetical protein [Planctomycetaceae bacterium]
MSRIVDFPDSLYEQLQSQAMASGFATIPELLANSRVEPRMKEDSLAALIERIDSRREQLRSERGVLPSCVPLIREDRDRMLAERRALFEQITSNRQVMFEQAGRSPDCVPMIREDRER